MFIIMFIILITFLLGFPKKVKEIVSVLVIREGTDTHKKLLRKFSMRNIKTGMIRGFYHTERQLINAEEGF